MGQIRYRDGKRSIRRIKKGSGFSFVDKNGEPIGPKRKARIESLRIPPAWRDVNISPDPKDYIQATGVDSRGRTQYIYHPEWVKENQKHKFDEMISFGESLPTLREAVSAHMREHSLSRDRVVATIVWLLENTFIRVGNKNYAKENESYGLTTMREKHLDLKGNKITFSFKGKSGVYHEQDITHPRVAATLRACIELPGYELFKYIDQDGNKKIVDSADVNHYLQTHTGAAFSAKDFRTWGGSVLAADSLYHKGSAKEELEIKNNIASTVEEVSEHLGNTKKVCRVYYIHPTVINSYERDILVPHFDAIYHRPHKHLSLAPEEYATWSLIKDA